jgi:thiol-disulfide isomerase/thioredoxin
VKVVPSGETSIRKQHTPGRRTLINLWATWCTPCRHEMPELEQIRTRLGAKGFDLIGLNVDTDPKANVAQFLRETKAQYPILLGGAAAVEQLFSGEELSVPLTIVVDENGVVTELIPGWSGATKRRFGQLAGTELDSGSTPSK